MDSINDQCNAMNEAQFTLSEKKQSAARERTQKNAQTWAALEIMNCTHTELKFHKCVLNIQKESDN